MYVYSIEFNDNCIMRQEHFAFKCKLSNKKNPLAWNTRLVCVCVCVCVCV